MTTIQKITIPQPCQQAWQNMTPNNQGRHCDHCAKTVIDFAAMTDAQLIKYLITHNNVCGRFSLPQLDSVNSQLHLQNLRKDVGWKRWAMAAALFGSTVFNKAIGQLTTSLLPKTEQSSTSFISDNFPKGKIKVDNVAHREIRGQVLGADDHLPVVGATLKAESANIGAITDTSGHFTLNVPLSARQLTASYIGYVPKTMTIDSTRNEIYDVKLSMQPSVTGGLMVEMPFYARAYYRFIWRPLRAIFH